ncbi:hypothetical protein AAMO2058_001068600 [Amorphochlora amoebiformis]
MFKSSWWLLPAVAIFRCDAAGAGGMVVANGRARGGSGEELLVSREEQEKTAQLFPFKLSFGKSKSSGASSPPKEKDPPKPKIHKPHDIGKIITTIKPAGNSFPPKYDQYEGAIYGKRYIPDPNARLPSENRTDTFPKRTSSGTSGKLPHEVFPQAFHILPGPGYVEHRKAQLGKSNNVLDVGRMFGVNPMEIRYDKAG